MTKTEATADGFVAVLKALPRRERDAVLVRIADDKDLAHDILDLVTFAQRQDEPSRPFREYLKQRRSE